jgi:Arylsulfotransferase (ASST)
MNSRTIRRISRFAAGSALLLAAVPATAAASGRSHTAAPTAPPPVTVLSDRHARGADDVFVTPTDDTAQTQAEYANGAEILNRAGKRLWWHAAPAGDTDADLRVQRYEGKPVLTFWEGKGLGGLSDGTDYILNQHYKTIGSVRAGDNLTTDGHEFLLAPHGRAWIISYDTATADLSSIGGPSNQTVIDGIIEEIDIKTGKVLFSWNSADHVPYSQSEQPLPTSAGTPWDWFHANAVKLGPNGSVLIDARDTWTTYDVSRRTGEINWQLGGKASTFTLRAAPGQTLNAAGDIFAWQHDPEWIGQNTLTIFDNEAAGTANTGVAVTSELPVSRVVTIRLDPATKVATLVASDDQSEGGLASSQGDGQRLPGGGEFVGWGILNSVSQFSRAGTLVWNLDFPVGVNTYRAYLEPWGAGAS